MVWRNTWRVQLILMRHGVAVERDEWSGDDFSRPLTPDGHDKTRKAARGLALFCAAPGLIATSPKVRALQTAELAQEAWRKKPPLEVWDELAESDLAFWRAKLETTAENVVLVVGHEPDLSRFASQLLGEDEEAVDIAWKKAGAMLLDANLPIGRATLQWMLPPRALRLLRE